MAQLGDENHNLESGELVRVMQGIVPSLRPDKMLGTCGSAAFYVRCVLVGGLR